MKKSTVAIVGTLTVAMVGLGYLFMNSDNSTAAYSASAETIHTIQAEIKNPELGPTLPTR